MITLVLEVWPVDLDIFDIAVSSSNLSKGNDDAHDNSTDSKITNEFEGVDDVQNASNKTEASEYEHSCDSTWESNAPAAFGLDYRVWHLLFCI